jgi:hypothetical protein
VSPSITSSEGLLPEEQRRLTAGECRRWLHLHHEGRLGYLSGSGQRSVVVSYTVADEQILLQVPDYNEISQYAPGARVTLAVDGVVEPSSASEPLTGEVVVTGTAGHETTRPSIDTVRFEESWPTGIRTSIVTLPLTRVVGVQRRRANRLSIEHPDTS